MTAAPPVPLCEVHGIRKSFSGVVALDGVDLTVRRGEIHGLLGENGAGKSTLIRILSGVIEPDSGQVLVQGSPAALKSPRAARELGIAAAHQDPGLFHWQSAVENCFNQRGLPGNPFIDWRAARGEAREALARLGGEVPPYVPVGLLSASQRQVVALAGALLAHPRLLILDEPTAALSARESESLFAILKELRAAGGSVIYVSHRLGEVAALADRVTVLRDGRVVRTAAGGTGASELVEAMVGRRLEVSYPRPPRPAGPELALEVVGLTDAGGAFRDVSFSVRRGEIFGLYGLVGAGRSELGQALAGLRPARGEVKAAGRLAYLPQDRLAEGNLPGLGLRENLSISALPLLARGPFIAARRERDLAASLRSRLSIRAPSLEAEIGTLSGGNQQKALLGRWLATEPDVLVLDEPTQGIDVGARAEIHQITSGLARAGRAVVLISSDLPEALGLSHRLGVFREGRLASILDSAGATEEEAARAAFPAEHARGPGGASGLAGGRWVHALRQRELALALTLVLVGIATEIRSGGFLAASSLRDMAANGSGLALAALGETLVIATGAIDISIGSILALSATAAALWGGQGGGAAASILLAVLLGLALGSFNAGLSALGRLHPIITTLGTLGIFRGCFLLWTKGDWLDLPPSLLDLATAGPLGVPWSVWGVGIAAASLSGFLRWTRAGRACLKTGDNPGAARTHGFRVGIARWTAFGILGALTGLAGVFYTARFGKVQSSTGVGFELQAIAAAVLGGAHVSGGRGTVAGALLGAALIQALADARAVWGVHERWQLVLVGGLMLAALALETALARLSRARGR